MKPPVVILAAGKSSRMHPLDTYDHKSFIPVVGQSLIERTVASLVEHDFHKIILVTSPLSDNGEQTIKKLKNTHPQAELITVTQPQALGMGNAVLLTRDHLQNTFFVISPHYVTIGQHLDQLLQPQQSLVLCSQTTETPWIYGMLELNDQGQATGIVEKPEKGTEPSDQKIISAYLLNQDFLNTLEQEDTTEYNFEAALDKAVARQPAPVVKLETDLLTYKYPWHLFGFMNQALAKLPSYRSPQAQIAETAVIDESHGPVYIENGAQVGHAAKVAGPCYIGRDSLVGDFSFVRQSSLEEGAQVGANTEVVRSLILAGATIHYSYLADSILGEKSKIGAGLITANKRFDRQVIRTFVKTKMVATQLKALGTIIGHATNTGVGVRTMPGVMIGPEQVIEPGSIVRKNI